MKTGIRFVDKIKLRELNDASLVAADKALYLLASFIHRSARSSIRKRSKPSAPGKPYSKQTGFMRDSLVVNRDKTKGTAKIGYYRGNRVGDALELGGVLGRRKKRKYPARSALEPAVEKAISDFARKYPGDFQKYFTM